MRSVRVSNFVALLCVAAIRAAFAAVSNRLSQGVVDDPKLGFLDPPSHHRVPTIVTSSQERHWWGFPNYLKVEDKGLRNWEEFARDHGHLGRTCSAQTSPTQCGHEFVCKNGACVTCVENRDCGEHYKCQLAPMSGHMLCIPRDLAAQWHWREVVATVLIVLTAMLSAAAGMGGGGVYVPLLLLLLGLSTKEAVPLSQAMIVGGATVNILMFSGERHPKNPQKSRIDYDVIMMMNPGLAAGVTIGVMCHIVSPQWLIVTVLVVTLVITLEKSAKKGYQQWNKESQALAEARAKGISNSNSSVQIKFADLRGFIELAEGNQKPLTLIVGCWLCFLVSNVLKAPSCTGLYWLQVFGQLVICAIFTREGAKTITSRAAGTDKGEGVLQWTPTTLWLYPAMSMVAGFLGGFLGIGGGIIMGPLLIELGMVAEANQATTALFVFLSSSLATVQFVALGKTMPQFVIWFTTWVLLSTFVGQTLIDYALRRWQRSSLIVISIAGIIAGSLVMMTIIGSFEIVSDLSRGAYMGFRPSALCM